MENIKQIIAKNITELRQEAKMTQIELAEKLNYSDKAVSKWERGESVPDIAVLAQIAEMYGVTLDYLIHAEHEQPEPQQVQETAEETAEKAAKPELTAEEQAFRHRRRGFITGMSVLLVWLVATAVFVLIELLPGEPKWHWLSFVYAVPVSMIVWLVFNSIWFTKRRNYLIISLLMWTVLASIFFTFLAFDINILLIFALGIPGQIIILMWSMLGYKK